MTADDYISNRLDEQYNWHDKKSIEAQNTYKRVHRAQLISAGAVPVLAVFTQVGEYWVQFAIALAGLITAVLTGLQNANQWQQNWIRYRAIAEALKSEKMRYQTKTGRYEGDDEDANFKALVQKVEDLLTGEILAWESTMQAAAKPKTAKK